MPGPVGCVVNCRLSPMMPAVDGRGGVAVVASGSCSSTLVLLVGAR